MSTSHGLVTTARGATALVLLGLLVFGPGGDRSQDGGWIVTGSTPFGALAAELASESIGPITYRDSVPPTRGIAGLLAGGATGGRTISLRAPTSLPTLSVRAPLRPMAQRRTALTITVRGDANDSVFLAIEDRAGHVDTVTVALGPLGSLTTQIAVEPARAGVERWTVRAAVSSARGAEDGAVIHAEATASTWVRPAAPLRVLVLSGPPGWETRYLVRALEASGIEVDVRQELGRSLVVASGEDRIPVSLDDLAGFDVVVSAGEGAAAVRSLVRRWVRDAGGGLLSVEGTIEAQRTLSAADLTWAGPAELIPLPALDLDVTGTPIALAAGEVAVAVAARAGATQPTQPTDVFVTAATHGRGRVLRSGLHSWPWVLEGGAGASHVAFWSSAVAWLAGGLTEEVLLDGPRVQPYTAWAGRIEGALPAALRVTSPQDTTSVHDTQAPIDTRAFNDLDAGSETESLAIVRTGAGRGLVRFVPTGAGTHTFAIDGGPPFAATIVEASGERLSWADAALEVGAGGGSIVAAEGASPGEGAPLAGGNGRDRLIFLALAVLMSAAWTIRRFRGLA